MSAGRPRVPVVPAALTLLAALLLGFWGNHLFQGWLERPESGEAADLDTGDLDQRTDRLGLAEGRAPGHPPSGTGPEVTQADTAPTADDPELLAIRERLAADLARREERARLASDSPLTPGVAAAAELAERGPDPPPAAPVPDDGPQDGAAVRSATGTAAARAPAGPEPPPVPPGPGDGVPTHLLARGSFIPAVLRTPVDSDLPGLVLAQVSEPVLDSVTGAHTLVPRGSSIVGEYGTDAAAGQRRMSIRWTDLRMPDGTPLGLRDFPAVGDDGASGVRGARRTNVAAALGAAVLFDLAGNATAIITGDNARPHSDLASILGGAAGSATSRVAQEYLGRLLDRGPRFRVRPGTLVNVLVERDILLPSRGGP